MDLSLSGGDTLTSQLFTRKLKAVERISVDKVDTRLLADEFLSDEQSRIALNYFFSLKEVWQLSKEEEEQLLRDSKIHYPVRPNSKASINKQTQNRIGLLLEIWGTLHQIYGSNSAAANKWIRKKPTAELFKGKTPLELMSTSDDNLKAVSVFLRKKLERLS